jgi:formate/nitrite transporter FocA (FNT family)
MSDGDIESSRPHAQQIYDRVRADGYDELGRTNHALGFSGLFAGFTLGATVTAYAAALTYLRGAAVAPLVAALLYPVGYVGAILGRAQLFTENTLYPILVVIEDRTRVRATARLWVVVLAANLAGALLFALIVTQTSALPGAVTDRIAALGRTAIAAPTWHTFWAAVLAGWLLALVAWLVEATDTATGALLVVWVTTMVVGLLTLDHSIATALQAWAAVLDGRASAGPALGWEAMTILGNVLGGVFIVSVVNYGQVRAGGG